MITHHRRGSPQGAVLSPSLLERSVLRAHSLDGCSESLGVAFYFKTTPPSLPSLNRLRNLPSNQTEITPSLLRHTRRDLTTPLPLTDLAIGGVRLVSPKRFSTATFQDAPSGLNMPVSSKCNGGKHACSVGNAKLQTKRQAVSCGGGSGGGGDWCTQACCGCGGEMFLRTWVLMTRTNNAGPAGKPFRGSWSAVSARR